METTTETPKRKYTKKIKSEREELPLQLVAKKKSIRRIADTPFEIYTKSGLEVLKYFDGKNLDNGNDPMDLLLKGKKIVWKTRWVIQMTNIKNHGKIMSEERAMESGPNTNDNFFDWNYFGRKEHVSKYIKPHFVIMEKKGKKIIYDDESFIDFCDVLGKLG